MGGEESAEIAFGNSNNASDPMRDQKLLIDPAADGPITDVKLLRHRLDRS